MSLTRRGFLINSVMGFGAALVLPRRIDAKGTTGGAILKSGKIPIGKFGVRYLADFDVEYGEIISRIDVVSREIRSGQIHVTWKPGTKLTMRILNDGVDVLIREIEDELGRDVSHVRDGLRMVVSQAPVSGCDVVRDENRGFVYV